MALKTDSLRKAPKKEKKSVWFPSLLACMVLILLAAHVHGAQLHA